MHTFHHYYFHILQWGHPTVVLKTEKINFLVSQSFNIIMILRCIFCKRSWYLVSLNQLVGSLNISSQAELQNTPNQSIIHINISCMNYPCKINQSYIPQQHTNIEWIIQKTQIWKVFLCFDDAEKINLIPHSQQKKHLVSSTILISKSLPLSFQT